MFLKSSSGWYVEAVGEICRTTGYNDVDTACCDVAKECCDVNEVWSEFFFLFLIIYIYNKVQRNICTEKKVWTK